LAWSEEAYNDLHAKKKENQTKENIYQMVQTEGKTLWQKTSGNFKELRKYINKDDYACYPEDDLFSNRKWLSKYREKINSDIAGMGKSTFLAKSCEELRKSGRNNQLER